MIIILIVLDEGHVNQQTATVLKFMVKLWVWGDAPLCCEVVFRAIRSFLSVLLFLFIFIRNIDKAMKNLHAVAINMSVKELEMVSGPRLGLIHHLGDILWVDGKPIWICKLWRE